MMKGNRYSDIICKGFCRYYKKGKEELTCGTYNFLSGILTSRELESMSRRIAGAPDFSCDMEIRKVVCRECDFLVDGCDFREGFDAPPCGGYAIIEWLMKKAEVSKR